MKELAKGYAAEFDSVDKEGWSQLVERFGDANIYQTSSYEAVRSGPNNVGHLVLRKYGETVAAAQVRLIRIPVFDTGIAYIRWGPLWRLTNAGSDTEIFRQAIRALRNEYACQRRLMVRILPLLFDDEPAILNLILLEEGFVQATIKEAQRTLLVNLTGSFAALRKGLDQKWRNRLNRAERNGLEIIEGFSDDLFGLFIDIYAEMYGRKRFLEGSDVNQFRMIQRDLPGSFKMKILIAFSDGKPAAGVVCSGIGDMGIYLFGATSNAGLSTQASYLLQWKVLSWLKEKGATWYNLHGINPITNPGTYRFKAGLCGKNGKDVFFLGAYDACEGMARQKVFRIANSAMAAYRKGKVVLNRLRQ